MEYKSYKQMQKAHHKAVNELIEKYVFFAFSDEQFADGMKKFGLGTDPESIAKICRFYGGGYILKSHAAEAADLFHKQADEFADRCNDPETGRRFLYEAFREELSNHEYSYTGDPSDALDALGMEWEDLQSDPGRLQIFREAAAACMNEDE